MTTVDLFAGAGGLALGLSKAGFDNATLIECDQYACSTIRENIRHNVEGTENWHLCERNVQDYNYSSLTDKVDLLCAGLPCQPFSVAGKGRAHKDTRDMFPEVVRAVREIRPKIVLLENVKGLLRSRFRAYFDYLLLAIALPHLDRLAHTHWRDHLAALRQHEKQNSNHTPHYSVFVHELNAADYGIPQWRERILIVAIRSDLRLHWTIPDPTHSVDALLWNQWKSADYWNRHGLTAGDATHLTPRIGRHLRKVLASSEWARPNLLPWRTVRDAIGDLPGISVGGEDSLANHTMNAGARIYRGHSGSRLDEPAKTLKAGSHGVPGGENTLLLGDQSVRYFSIRECARLQTFPDDYVFVGPWSRAMRQVGNAVPVDLAQIVGTHLRTGLEAIKSGNVANDIPHSMHLAIDDQLPDAASPATYALVSNGGGRNVRGLG